MAKHSKRFGKSRRNAFRLPCGEHSITCKTAYDEGAGVLINISSGGCFFELPNLPLSVHEKIFISIDLEEQQYTVEAKALVVRASEKKYGAKFILIEPETQGQIRSYFIQKLRNQ